MDDTFHSRRTKQLALVKTFSIDELNTEIEDVTNAFPAIRWEMNIGLHPSTAIMEANDYVSICRSELRPRIL